MSDDRRQDGLKVLQDPFCDAVAESGSPSASSSSEDTILRRLRDFALRHDRTEARALIDDLLLAGVDRSDLAEHFVPATAYALGDSWCADEVDFARVTIGAARLQGLLRDLTADWSASASPRPDGPTILVVTLPGRTHTLGAMVMAAQLRRRGCSVRLALGLPRADTIAKLSAIPFNAVFVSASLSESVDDVADVARASKSAKRDVPVVVGGSILEKSCDRLAIDGADHLTSNVDEALSRCGLANLLASAEQVRV